MYLMLILVADKQASLSILDQYWSNSLNKKGQYIHVNAHRDTCTQSMLLISEVGISPVTMMYLYCPCD